MCGSFIPSLSSLAVLNLFRIFSTFKPNISYLVFHTSTIFSSIKLLNNELLLYLQNHIDFFYLENNCYYTL